MDGKWLSILEYANYKKKSISTVRRYIKANRVKTKEENGKYYIWARGFQEFSDLNSKEIFELRFDNERLKKENKYLKEQLSELQMLINIYENDRHTLPPEVPGLRN